MAKEDLIVRESVNNVLAKHYGNKEMGIELFSALLHEIAKIPPERQNAVKTADDGKKMTNREKLSQMSDERLAKVLSGMCPPGTKTYPISESGDFCERIHAGEYGKMITGECHRCWLDWLGEENNRRRKT